MTIPAQTDTTVTRFQRVCIILNRNAGDKTDPEPLIRATIAAHPHLEWDIRLTNQAEDARVFARNALEEGYDLIIAGGGDGTVMHVAAAIQNTRATLSILPLGTANVMSVELGFPQDTVRILNGLAQGQVTIKRIDTALIDGKPMMLRAGIGLEADMSTGASRAEKQRFGRWAYLLTIARKLRGTRPVTYTVTCDGITHIGRGLTCMICNSASIGLPNLSFSSDVNVSDGMIDAIVIDSARADSIMRVLWSVIGSTAPAIRPRNKVITHWQGREIEVQVSRTQTMAIDGEKYKRDKIMRARVVPGALTVAVPSLTPVPASNA